MVVRWTRWTLTRRKWAWGVSSQLLTSHHLLQTHSGQLGKHSKLLSQEVVSLYLSQHTNSSYFKSKILVETSANLEPLSGKHWNSFISGIFLICWISFSASSHSLTRQSKNPEQSQCFQFPPEKWFCFMRDVTSTPVWLTNNFKYSALHCTVLQQSCFYKKTQNIAGCSS